MFVRDLEARLIRELNQMNLVFDWFLVHDSIYMYKRGLFQFCH